jgi:predicted amidohydrolase YtcJ
MAKNLDLIIKGNIITVVNQKPRAEAIGIKGEKIVSVGTEAEVSAGAGPNTKVLDVKGKTVLPGFIDSHAHPMGSPGQDKTESQGNRTRQPHLLPGL